MDGILQAGCCKPTVQVRMPTMNLFGTNLPKQEKHYPGPLCHHALPELPGSGPLGMASHFFPKITESRVATHLISLR